MNLPRQRNRRQEGWIELDKQTSPHSWKARWLDWSQTRTDKNGRVRPAQRSLVLGSKTAKDLPTKSAAEEKWAKLRPTVMKRSGNNPAPSFQEFVADTFVPERTALRPWRRNSRRKFEYLMSKVLPVFGDRELGSITTAELQRFLVDLAKAACHDTVAGALTYLKAIFRHAVENDVLGRSPAQRLVLPPTKERRRPFLTGDQIAQLEARLSGRDLIILRLLSRCGMRAGEVFGLQWADVRPERTISICRTFSKGEIGPPKTRASAKPVAVPKALYEALIGLRGQLEGYAPEDWIFPASKKRGAALMPVSPENWLKRGLKPLARKLGFEVNLHMFRRSVATLAHANGATFRDIQEQLRHASASTTANIYVQPVPDSVRQTVEKLDRAMRKNAKQQAASITDQE